MELWIPPKPNLFQNSGLQAVFLLQTRKARASSHFIFSCLILVIEVYTSRAQIALLRRGMISTAWIPSICTLVADTFSKLIWSRFYAFIVTAFYQIVSWAQAVLCTDQIRFIGQGAKRCVLPKLIQERQSWSLSVNTIIWVIQAQEDQDLDQGNTAVLSRVALWTTWHSWTKWLALMCSSWHVGILFAVVVDINWKKNQNISASQGVLLKTFLEMTRKILNSNFLRNFFSCALTS